MSNTVALYPVVGALVAAMKIGKARGPFCAGSGNKDHVALQEDFLKNYFVNGSEALSFFSPEEMQYMAALNAGEINDWLKSKGFNIELSPFTDADQFGTASVMDVTVKWVTEGEDETLHVKRDDVDRYYQGGLVTQNVVATSSPHHPHPIAHIQCKNGDKFHITVADQPRDRFDLMRYIEKITNESKSENKFNSVHYPMVDLDQEVDIGFFVDMSFPGIGVVTGKVDSYGIVEAKQQTIFKLNESGARAKSAAAFSCAMECLNQRFDTPVVIDAPFFVWLTRDGLPYPYFAGYVTEEHWNRPNMDDDSSSESEKSSDSDLGTPEVMSVSNDEGGLESMPESRMPNFSALEGLNLRR